MHLALGGARPNRSPAHQRRQVLRRHHVEELGARGHSHFRQIEQKVSRQPQAIVDLVRLIEMRIVDQPFPAHRGARLLEVHPHYDVQLARKFGDRSLQQPGILPRCPGVVDRARPHHHQQPAVFARQDVADAGARLMHGGGRTLGHRHLFFEEHRRKHNFGPLYAEIIDGIEHGHVFGSRGLHEPTGVFPLPPGPRGLLPRQMTSYSHSRAGTGWRNWSGREDLNLRPPAPKAGALPGCATPRLFASLILNHFQQRNHGAMPSFGTNSAKTGSKLCQNPISSPSLCQN